MASQTRREATEAAKELGKLGASKGGRARANVLTAQERSEIARDAARKRWLGAGKNAGLQDNPRKTGSSNHVVEEALSARPEMPARPHSLLRGSLRIGDLELECHVLSHGQRVLTQREMVRVISGGRDSSNLSRYLERNPLTANGFAVVPIEFDVPGTSLVAHGYEATTLIEIAEKYLEARDQGLLKGAQYRLAKNAETVIRACAKVGIIALIDEATGYQKLRQERELQLKLQAFIADDLQEWALMFPQEFWLELARLEGVRYSPRNRPLRWGKYIMMFVYDAIDKDIGKELRERNPNPRYSRNHHQWLKQFGRDKVHDQITRVVTIMRLCQDMDEFRQKFRQLFQREEQLQLWDTW